MTDIIIDIDTKEDYLHYNSVPRQTDHWRGAAVTAGGPHLLLPSMRTENYRFRAFTPQEPTTGTGRLRRASPRISCEAFAEGRVCCLVHVNQPVGQFWLLARRPCSAGAFGESWPQLLTLSLPLKCIIRRRLIERAPHVDVACLRDAALNVDRGARLPASRPQPEVGRDVARAAEPRGIVHRRS